MIDSSDSSDDENLLTEKVKQGVQDKLNQERVSLTKEKLRTQKTTVQSTSDSIPKKRGVTFETTHDEHKDQESHRSGGSHEKPEEAEEAEQQKSESTAGASSGTLGP